LRPLLTAYEVGGVPVYKVDEVDALVKKLATSLGPQLTAHDGVGAPVYKIDEAEALVKIETTPPVKDGFSVTVYFDVEDEPAFERALQPILTRRA
jgi:hypothetical protein